MPAATYDFQIEKGTSFYISFDYKDDASTPINLTNWCARLRWVENDGTTTRSYTTNTTNSEYQFTIDPLIGRIIFRLPAVSTAAFNFTSANYDLELQEPNDLYDGGGKKVFRLLQGIITLITRNVPDDSAFECTYDPQDPCTTC